MTLSLPSFFASAMSSVIERAALPLSGGAMRMPRSLAQARPGLERTVSPAAAAMLRLSICDRLIPLFVELAPELELLRFVVLHLPLPDGIEL